MNPTVALTLASLKMFYRNRQALFFSLFLPFLIMGIFGILNFDAFTNVDVGVVDEAQNSDSKGLIQALANSDVLDLTKGDREEQVSELEDGKLDLVIILPQDFGASKNPSKVLALLSASRPQEAQVGASVLSRVLDDLAFQQTGAARPFELESREVTTRDLEYVDFLVPGVIAMSIMQIGLFSVTFAIIRYRQQGVLRRLMAAPIHPGHFLAGQVITRLSVSLMQTFILLGAGVLVLGVDIRGNVLTLAVLAVLGGALFISMGYAVSGFAKTEESAAPVANLISMPMMFLSGVFFARDNLPGFLETVTEFFPLTYLANGMREVTVEGSSLTAISGDLLGLGVWLVVSFFIATRVFSWE